MNRPFPERERDYSTDHMCKIDDKIHHTGIQTATMSTPGMSEKPENNETNCTFKYRYFIYCLSHHFQHTQATGIVV